MLIESKLLPLALFLLGQTRPLDRSLATALLQKAAKETALGNCPLMILNDTLWGGADTPTLQRIADLGPNPDPETRAEFIAKEQASLQAQLPA